MGRAGAAAPDRHHRRRRRRLARRTCPCTSASSFPLRASTTSIPTHRATPRAASACRPCLPRSPRRPAAADAIFDLAVPGDQIAGVLKELPRGAAVLIQKPMGEDLAAARSIADICRERGLVAAMNFQLRFSPNVLALRDLLAARAARGDRRHRSAAGREAAVAPMEISRAGAAPRDSLPLDSLPRHDTGPGGRAARRVLPRRCASVDARVSGHAQHDHSRLRQRAALLAAAQPHISAARGARCIVPEGRRHQRGGAADARRQHRLPERAS